jgi:hypothetical protein
MMRKWFAEHGTWVFIIVVVGGFGFSIYRSNPWQDRNKCGTPAEIQASEQFLKNYPGFDPHVGESILDYTVQRDEFEEHINKCKLKQRQSQQKQQHS